MPSVQSFYRKSLGIHLSLSHSWQIYLDLSIMRQSSTLIFRVKVCWGITRCCTKASLFWPTIPKRLARTYLHTNTGTIGGDPGGSVVSFYLCVYVHRLCALFLYFVMPCRCTFFGNMLRYASVYVLYTLLYNYTLIAYLDFLEVLYLTKV